jgi:hypothetical protein
LTFINLYDLDSYQGLLKHGRRILHHQQPTEPYNAHPITHPKTKYRESSTSLPITHVGLHSIAFIPHAYEFKDL